MLTKAGRFMKRLYFSMVKSTKDLTEPTEILEAICISVVEEHLVEGKPFIRVTDVSQVVNFTFDEVREELLQDPRVFPKYGSPNILEVDPSGGAE